MATDSIVGGLFGMTPESYQDTRQLLEQAQALQQAKLDPYEAVNYMAARAGQQLGRGIGGLLGAEDPQLQKITAIQALGQQFDITSPEGLKKAAVSIQGRYPDVAFNLNQQSNTINKQIQDQAKSFAETQKILAETAGKNVDLLATTSAVQTLTSMGIDRDRALAIAKEPKLLEMYLTPTTQKAFEFGKTGKFTPESLTKYASSGDFSDLVEIDKMSKPTTDWLGAARALRIDAKAKYGDYTPEEAQRINQYLLNKDVTKNAAMRPPAQETAFATTRGQLQAKALQEVTLSAQNAQTALVTLNSMEGLSKSGQLYTGPLAMTALGASNLLNSIGLLSKEQSRVLANAEQYDKGAKDLVMNELEGKLGAQISDADRKFVEARIPQLTTSPLARSELIAKIKEIQTGKINAYQNMNNHANQFGNLNSFNFSQNYMPPPLAKSPLANPSGSKQMSPIDQQALDWATANPKDPRSAQIKQRLGM